jgi:hypothetical protein
MVTDLTPAARRDPLPRMRDAKNLKWLTPYRELGYTFERNGHLKVFDPSGRLVTTIPCTPSDSGYRNARALLRRHERTRTKDFPITLSDKAPRK